VQQGSKKKRKSLDLTKPVERPRMPIMVMLRMFLLGSVAVVAASYAIYRHYFVPRPPMSRPVPSATEPSPDPASSDLLPVPELVPLPAPSP
jgi:hypothetical protein